MTEYPKAWFQRREHPPEQKWIFWGPEVKPAWVEYVFRSGQSHVEFYSKAQFEAMELEQAHTPVRLMHTPTLGWWRFEGVMFLDREGLTDPLVVKGLILQRRRRREARLEKARKVGEAG